MKRTIYLSRAERRIGGRFFLRFTAFNGLGVTFLGDATVTLLAIRFGAGNLELGLISAMLHISGIALLVVPRIFRDRNVIKVAFWAWMVRGLASLPYVALLFIDGKPAVALIMGLYGLFCLSRTAGMSMVTTVQKRLMINRTQGEVIFRTASSFQGTQILSRIVSYLVLSLNFIVELSGLLVLQGLGVITNTLAAFSLRRIPNRTRTEYKKGENILVILARNVRNPHKRRILLLRWIAMGQLILFAMIVPFLRRSVGVSSASIFLYTISVSLAAFVSSISLRPIVDRAGSRPLLFFSAIPAAALLLYWVFVRNDHHLAVYAVAGFVTMFFVNSSGLAVNRLLMSITPDEGAVGFNSMETFVTSILAVILGFGAGYLADLSDSLKTILPINAYGLVFLPAAMGSIWQTFLVFKVNEPGSLRLQEAATIITNVGNLRTWQTVSNLETTADPVKRKTLVHNMGHSRAPVASSEIGKILAEPLSQEKGELIDALFFTKRPELLGFLRDEALDPSSFHRTRAIFALGAYTGEESETTLNALLDDPDTGVRATAAKSLGRIGSKTHLDIIYQRWKETTKLHERLDYMIALFHMDPDRRYISDLFSPMIVASGERSERTLFTLLARQFGMVPALGTLYRDEGSRFGKGLEALLEESRDTRFLLEHGGEVESLWTGGGFDEIWKLCREALAQIQPPEDLEPVVRGLLGFPPESGDQANALAGLYFTYQLLTAEAGT